MLTAKEFIAMESGLYNNTLKGKPGTYRRLNPGTYYVKHHGEVYVVTKLGKDTWTWMNYNQAHGNDLFRTLSEAKDALEYWVIEQL